MSDKWERREQKIKAKKNQMPKHGMSVLTIEIIVQKRAERAKAQNRKWRKNRAKDKVNLTDDNFYHPKEK